VLQENGAVVSFVIVDIDEGGYINTTGRNRFMVHLETVDMDGYLTLDDALRDFTPESEHGHPQAILGLNDEGGAKEIYYDILLRADMEMRLGHHYACYGSWERKSLYGD